MTSYVMTYLYYLPCGVRKGFDYFDAENLIEAKQKALEGLKRMERINSKCRELLWVEEDEDK